MPRDLGDPVDRDDVGVLEPRDRARLVEEPRPRVGVVGRLHELHRDRPIEQQIAVEVHRAHGAATEQPYQLVLLELLGGPPFGLGHVSRGGPPILAPDTSLPYTRYPT